MHVLFVFTLNKLDFKTFSVTFHPSKSGKLISLIQRGYTEVLTISVTGMLM